MSDAVGVRRALFVAPFDALADPRVLARLGAEAEDAGWDGLFLWDHTAYTDPVRVVVDPWVSLATIAASTSRILLGAMVTPLPRRRPAVVARQAVTLDLASSGRLVLGFGIGDDGRAREMSRYGEEPDPARRAEMLDEGLDVLTAMLAGADPAHRGRYYVAEGAPMLPGPVGPVPIWIAGRWPAVAPLRRAARHDGAFVISLRSPADAAAVVDCLRELRGGDLDGYDVVVELPAGAPAADWAVAGVTWLLTTVGPVDLDVDEVRAVVSAGPG